MTTLKIRMEAFVKLGEFFGEYYKYSNSNIITENTNAVFLKLDSEIALAKDHNRWFTKNNILFCLKNWADILTKKQLKQWLAPYNINKNKYKKVAVIMAGNIPLVGFHDFLSTLITGNSILVKLSLSDKIMLPFIADFLIKIEPLLKTHIKFVEGQLENYDFVIATGSTNTSRYFKHYFSKKPNIIRKSRNSVAILTGTESIQQLEALGEDIFRYYGLGCRSVSKLFVPKGYNFDVFFNAIYKFNPIINQFKYSNNYDYNKAVYLMSEFKILDNGFLMLKEDKNYASPIATLFYEYYNSLDLLEKQLQKDKNSLQCIVSQNFADNEIPFGQTQLPSLNDYADGVDTIAFLLKN